MKDNKLFAAAVAASALFLTDILINSVNLYHSYMKLKVLKRCNELQYELKEIMVRTMEEAESKATAAEESTKEEN